MMRLMLETKYKRFFKKQSFYNLSKKKVVYVKNGLNSLTFKNNFSYITVITIGFRRFKNVKFFIVFIILYGYKNKNIIIKISFFKLL